MDHNAVKSPKHYTEGRRFEPKDVIRDWRLNFNLGSALKYIARAGRKGDIVEDLEKAREYLAFEIEAIKAERGRERELLLTLIVNALLNLSLRRKRLRVGVWGLLWCLMVCLLRQLLSWLSIFLRRSWVNESCKGWI